jgi:glutamate formiminotransferase / formiminotetrahydrofolate cyclodeaminase
MPGHWIECIPNFSEGRDPTVIRALESAITDVAGVLLLDRHSDPDHHRTVLTFVGPPDFVMRAAFNAVRVAAMRIDLARHQGTHPFIGAADVVPFVPLGRSTLAEGVCCARTLGQRVGEELHLPVFLYEAAAQMPERSALEVVRRGGYERLRQSIGRDAFHTPDYGPAAIGSAGAVAIGARSPLIAFNIYLATQDVEIARRIARRIRASSGGLPGVKALGMFVSGRAQVSMNITNYRLASLATVFQTVGNAAESLRTSIDHSEIIGLIPRAALPPSGLMDLAIDPTGPDPILENRIVSVAKESGFPMNDPGLAEALCLSRQDSQ